MSALSKSLLLFALNWLDAQLTILWVRAGLATEGNGLMARLLDAGNAPFLLAKLSIGALVALIFYRFAHLPLARRGVKLALAVYTILMLIHATTGLSAVDSRTTDAAISFFGHLNQTLLAAL